MKKSHKDSHFVLLNTLSTGFKQMGHNNTSKNTKYIHKRETEVLIHSRLKNYWYGINIVWWNWKYKNNSFHNMTF